MTRKSNHARSSSVHQAPDPARRRLLQTGAAAATGLLLSACTDGLPPVPSTAVPDTSDSSAQLLPTPACDDHDETPAQTAGPFYTPETPQRSNLREPGMAGAPLLLSGRVLTTDCQPVANALLDFWQADASGAYDNQGFRLRGHQFTDAEGRYQLQTILPGLYPGRTRHIHVRVQESEFPLLTTQLYFPGEPQNARDGIFDPALLVMMADGDGEETAAMFDFVLG